MSIISINYVLFLLFCTNFFGNAFTVALRAVNPKDLNMKNRPRSMSLFSKRGKESSLGRESVNAYLNRFGESKNKLKDPTVLQSNFLNLSKAVNGDEAAAEIVTIWPEILCVPPERVTGNMEIFTETFEFEPALGMVTRNPNLFAVPTDGYGSSRAACDKGGGKDMMAMSYVIATTRPIGKPLLGLLSLLLLKAAIFGPGTSF